jgi:hypothetical protein
MRGRRAKTSTRRNVVWKDQADLDARRAADDLKMAEALRAPVDPALLELVRKAVRS